MGADNGSEVTAILLEDATVKTGRESHEEWDVAHSKRPRLPPCHSIGEYGVRLSMVGNRGGEGDVVDVSA